jgi:potassium-dependent mechanosensitive channel
MIPQAIRQFVRCLFAVFVIMAVTFPVAAADPPKAVIDQSQAVDALAAKAESIRPKIDAASGDDAALVKVRTDLDQLQKSVLDVAVAYRPRIAEINKRLADLGAAPTGDASEPPAVTAERNQLTSEKATINLILGETEDLSVAIGRMIEDIGQRRRDLFAADLTKRQDIVSVFSSDTFLAFETEISNLNRIVRSWFTFVARFKVQSMLGAAFFALLAAAVILIGGRRLFGDFYRADPAEENPSYLSRLSVAFWSTLLPAASFAVFLGVTYLLFEYFKVLRTDIRELMYSAFSMAAIVFFIHRLAAAVLSPTLPNWRLAPVEAKPARLLVYLLTATAVVTGLDGFMTVVAETLGSPLSLTIAKSFAASVLVGIFVVMISLVRPSGKSVIKSPFDRPSRTILFLLGLLPLAAALFGYIGLARFMTQQIVITGALVITMYLGFKSAQSLQAEGAFATSRIGQFLGRMFDLGEIAIDRVGVLVSLLINLLVLAIGIPLILLQWRFQWEDIRSFVVKAFNGFTVGSVTISLVGVFTGIAAFIVVLLLTRWFQRWLDSSILSRGKIDSGVRHSIRTAFGYAGMAVAGLIGISAAGIDLSSLALVAGALSLGIGFGLQNIVSNFVSGLILLAERPFKVGDWIVAGNAEGIVKKISVRATEIETFQKQTVILPNSELINAAVGNWTHRNRLGRVDIAISVAYNADPVAVQQILLEIARANPYVLKTPEPFVLFKGFGIASLDFDIRVHLADITQSPLVQNDIRFNVIRRFKEEGIETPYPKTDAGVAQAHAQDASPSLPATRKSAKPKLLKS